MAEEKNGTDIIRKNPPEQLNEFEQVLKGQIIRCKKDGKNIADDLVLLSHLYGGYDRSGEFRPGYFDENNTFCLSYLSRLILVFLSKKARSGSGLNSSRYYEDWITLVKCSGKNPPETASFDLLDELFVHALKLDTLSVEELETVSLFDYFRSKFNELYREASTQNQISRDAVENGDSSGRFGSVPSPFGSGSVIEGSPEDIRQKFLQCYFESDPAYEKTVKLHEEKIKKRKERKAAYFERYLSAHGLDLNTLEKMTELPVIKHYAE